MDLQPPSKKKKKILFVYALYPRRPRSPPLSPAESRPGKATQREAPHRTTLLFSRSLSHPLFLSCERGQIIRTRSASLLRSLSPLAISIPGGRACTSSSLLSTIAGMYRSPPSISARLWPSPLTLIST
jgi:hypothetical protein